MRIIGNTACSIFKKTCEGGIPRRSFILLFFWYNTAIILYKLITMYQAVIKNLNEKMAKTIEHFKHEIASLRTGRATPAIVDEVKVDYYGQRMLLNQISAISILPPSTIVIKPWDKGALPAIVSAITNANLGMAPIAESDFIRVTLPPLTQERKEQLIKVLHQKAEDARVAVRQEREDAIKKIDKMEKDGEIREDDKFRAKDEVQKIVDEYNNKIKETRDNKEKDIQEG